MILSIITLTYNNLDYTKKFVESLYKYTQDFELIIVDNGSTDGTVEYLKTIDGVKLILNKENAGYSKGNNQGLELAVGEYIGFLNNDILLYTNWFEECKHVFEKENAGFVSPLQINKLFNNANETNYIKKFKPSSSYRKSFDDCEFACCITKRSVIDKIGNFDENFTPAFWEDNDIKYRAIEAGYDTYTVSSVCFYHFNSVTSKNFSSGFEKNKVYYFTKHRFSEYLSVYANENFELKTRIAFFQKFPFNAIYNLHLLFEKIIRNIKRIF